VYDLARLTLTSSAWLRARPAQVCGARYTILESLAKFKRKRTL